MESPSKRCLRAFGPCRADGGGSTDIPRRDIFAIGASAGGLEALTTLVQGLPASLPAAVFVVLHTSPHSPAMLAHVLSRRGALPVEDARHGEAIEPGKIYVAPPDYHLLIRNGHLELSHGPRENHTRPAIDPLFRSAARAYGQRVVGVVLSGALGDGAAGLMAIKSRGGMAMVQEPSEALVGAMPRAALGAANVDYVLPVGKMAAVLTTLAQGESVQEGVKKMGDADEQDDRAATLPRRDIEAQTQGQRENEPAIYTCPDCGGTLWQIDENGVMQFACHVGHRYGAEVLLSQMSEELEAALWRCVRVLTEKATLTRQLAHRLRLSGDVDGAERVEEQAELDDRQQQLVRALVGEGTLDQAAQLLAAEREPDAS